MLKSKYSRCEFFFKSFLCYSLVRFPNIKITRERKKNIFRLIKNKDKIVGGHLKLYFYYKNKEQKLVVMYLELIFAGIKTERWKATEVRFSILELKQVGKIVFVWEIKTNKKDGLCLV